MRYDALFGGMQLGDVKQGSDLDDLLFCEVRECLGGHGLGKDVIEGGDECDFGFVPHSVGREKPVGHEHKLEGSDGAFIRQFSDVQDNLTRIETFQLFVEFNEKRIYCCLCRMATSGYPELNLGAGHFLLASHPWADE
jgi:hypothetical protein